MVLLARVAAPSRTTRECGHLKKLPAIKPLEARPSQFLPKLMSKLKFLPVLLSNKLELTNTSLKYTLELFALRARERLSMQESDSAAWEVQWHKTDSKFTNTYLPILSLRSMVRI
jgi:hypothetical protein